MILFDPDEAAANEVAGLPVRATLRRALSAAQTAVDLPGEVTVMFTTDAGIRRLNRRFRGKNKATDVLSFPAADPRLGVAGDLAISVETAARQAADQGHGLSVELRILILHGMLHLAGYDHEVDGGEMAAIEARLRQRLRLPLGLIERAGNDRSENNWAGRSAPAGHRKIRT